HSALFDIHRIKLAKLRLKTKEEKIIFMIAHSASPFNNVKLDVIGKDDFLQKPIGQMAFSGNPVHLVDNDTINAAFFYEAHHLIECRPVESKAGKLIFK